MIVRMANGEDAEAITALLKQLGYETAAKTLADKRQRFQRSHDDRAFVAVDDHAVIGCISIHTLELFHANGA